MILSPKGRNGIHAHPEVLGGVKVLSGFFSRLYSLGDCDIVSTREFCSGPTPGPAEVAGRGTASGRSTLRTVGCPEGGGDRQMHLASYCSSVLKVHRGCCTLGFAFVVVCAHPVEEACEVHTRNQQIQEPLGCLNAGLRSEGLSAHPSTNQTIFQPQSPTPSVWPHRVQKGQQLMWLYSQKSGCLSDQTYRPLVLHAPSAHRQTDPRARPPPREPVNNLRG